MTIQPDMPAFLDRRPFVGTYTILNTYKNVCQHQMYRRYIVKDQEYVESPEMAWGNKIHSAFEFRVGSGKPLPLDMQQWENFARPFDGQPCKVEQKLGVSAKGHSVGYWDSDVWFRGKADLTIIRDDTAYINDWKSGGSKYADPFELATNAVLIHARNPQLKKIVGSYTWLKENRLSQMYDLSDTRATWMEICQLMAEILEKKKTGEFEKRKSGLCGYCSVNDCQHWYKRNANA
ncbi:MAG: PD-(D/E)XK nuclease family protein [Patescibacteria group bacterium]|nr:PD-(D/E)XK nuclease family protein [Patescibacteria group bacterium]